MPNNIVLTTKCIDVSISKKEVEEIITMQLSDGNKSKQEIFLQEFRKRETAGDILIYDGVILPHFENDLLVSSEIIIINLLNPIEVWSKKIRNVDLIIGIFLKENEQLEIKRRIAKFIKKLADDEYIESLKIINSTEQLKQYIGGI